MKVQVAESQSGDWRDGFNCLPVLFQDRGTIGDANNTCIAVAALGLGVERQQPPDSRGKCARRLLLKIIA